MLCVRRNVCKHWVNYCSLCSKIQRLNPFGLVNIKKSQKMKLYTFMCVVFIFCFFFTLAIFSFFFLFFLLQQLNKIFIYILFIKEENIYYLELKLKVFFISSSNISRILFYTYYYNKKMNFYPLFGVLNYLQFKRNCFSVYWH